MKTQTGLLALAAALLAAPLAAQPAPGGPRAMMAEELRALNFAEIDTNGDGGITIDEWRSFVTARAEARRTAMLDSRVDGLMAGDTDGDGALSREELAARLTAQQAERREAMQAARAERGERGERGERRHERRGDHGPRHGRGHGGPGWGMSAEDADQRIVRGFQRIDRDGDGRITEAELTRAVERMTERLERRGRN